jgi:CRISPR-associated protein Cst2
MFHLFGNILTGGGIAANNRGEDEGNHTPLQKVLWQGEIYTTVSAEAIRFALRYYWQLRGEPVNRYWNADAKPIPTWHWQGDHDENQFIDDDVLGYMETEAAKKDNSDVQEEGTNSEEEASTKKKQKSQKKGKATVRKGVLEVSRACSMTAFAGNQSYNARSGEKSQNSLYSTEIHATRYQYGFSLTPHRLKALSRLSATLDGLGSLSGVAGNQTRFLYDFSPESIVLRWTHDVCPRFLYCFEESEEGTITVPKLLNKINGGDINPSELWVGGPIAKALEGTGANLFPGIKPTIMALKEQISVDWEQSVS